MTQGINQCIDVLSDGGLILYPTDTIWGIGCDATQPHAIEKIFKLKGRSSSKALITLVSSEYMLEKTVVDVPEIAWDLIEHADKPLTIIYDQVRTISKRALADDGSCAIRLINHSFCQKLINRFGKPIISTSANTSGHASPTTFSEIETSILNGVDFIVNFGQNESSKHAASNIIKLGHNGTVKIIR